MHSILSLLGIESWKPLLTALVLPPVPLLLLALVGGRLIRPRRGWGWLLLSLSLVGLWLGACSGFARAIEPLLIKPIPALRPDRIAEMRAEAASKAGKDSVAIVVLGGGVEAYAPEYGLSNLTGDSLERLRYGVWLSRETGWPLAFSGGVGWGNRAGAPEAEVAARIAKEEFGRPLRWLETDSRDTRENALRSVALLRQTGVRHVMLVTHGWHMQRARGLFEQAAADAGMRIEAAPMGLASSTRSPALDWLPSSNGFERVRQVLREWLGWKIQA